MLVLAVGCWGWAFLVWPPLLRVQHWSEALVIGCGWAGAVVLGANLVIAWWEGPRG